jgi:hypothetical protein
MANIMVGRNLLVDIDLERLVKAKEQNLCPLNILFGPVLLYLPYLPNFLVPAKERFHQDFWTEILESISAQLHGRL